MMQLAVTREEIRYLKQMQAKRRWDRLIPFSVNSGKATWPFETWGVTPEGIRVEVDGLCKKLDAIREEFLRVRESGGGFFICLRKREEGAYYKDQEKRMIKFVEISR